MNHINKCVKCAADRCRRKIRKKVSYESWGDRRAGTSPIVAVTMSSKSIKLLLPCHQAIQVEISYIK